MLHTRVLLLSFVTSYIYVVTSRGLSATHCVKSEARANLVFPPPFVDFLRWRAPQWRNLAQPSRDHCVVASVSRFNRTLKYLASDSPDGASCFSLFIILILIYLLFCLLHVQSYCRFVCFGPITLWAIHNIWSACREVSPRRRLCSARI